MRAGERVVLCGLEPDVVRVGLERRMAKALKRWDAIDWRPRAQSYEHTSATLEVDAELDALKLEPRVRRVVDEARRVLDVEREVEVHPTRARWACAHRAAEGPLLVSVHWRAFASVDDDALLAVVAHEIGHHLTAWERGPTGPDPSLVHRWSADGSHPEQHVIAAAYLRAEELTADRFSLLACQDLDAALRLLVALADDDEPEGRYTDPSLFLAAARARAEGLLARREPGRGDTHPELLVRAFALWLFSESDVYRRLIGRGAARPIADVDEILARLVGPHVDAADHEDAPIDEPTWFDGVGEAIYTGSARIGRALDTQGSKLSAVVRAAGGVVRGQPVEGAVAPAVELEVDALETDDLEARFAALERRMRAQSAGLLSEPSNERPEADPSVADLERRFAEFERRMKGREDG